MDCDGKMSVSCGQWDRVSLVGEVYLVELLRDRYWDQCYSIYSSITWMRENGQHKTGRTQDRVGALEGCAATQQDQDSLESWTGGHLMKFNKASIESCIWERKIPNTSIG